jgi:hypothetical protein
LEEENYRNTALFSLSLQRLGSYDWMAIGFGKPFGWIRRFGIHSKIVREMIVFAIFHPLLNYLASSSSLVVISIKSTREFVSFLITGQGSLSRMIELEIDQCVH